MRHVPPHCPPRWRRARGLLLIGRGAFLVEVGAGCCNPVTGTAAGVVTVGVGAIVGVLVERDGPYLGGEVVGVELAVGVAVRGDASCRSCSMPGWPTRVTRIALKSPLWALSSTCLVTFRTWVPLMCVVMGQAWHPKVLEWLNGSPGYRTLWTGTGLWNSASQVPRAVPRLGAYRLRHADDCIGRNARFPDGS